jgi:hypothetical protein
MLTSIDTDLEIYLSFEENTDHRFTSEWTLKVIGHQLTNDSVNQEISKYIIFLKNSWANPKIDMLK